VHLFSKGTGPFAVGWSTFSHWCPSRFILFVRNSCTCPPPFLSLLLTTMPHGSRSVTTSLDCVGAPTGVAVLCESDCPSSACVVQSERKKKKRVSVIVGNRKVPKKSGNGPCKPNHHCLTDQCGQHHSNLRNNDSHHDILCCQCHLASIHNLPRF
jgi:hypothetical protein